VTAQNLAQRFDMGQSCIDCGAWRGELGSEPTPEMFVDHLVSVFAEVHRVLRDDGTCWINLGDSYSGAGKGGGGSYQQDGLCQSKGTGRRTPLRPKNLVGIPWRVALALQSWGWILRSDIIWHKPNPMPFSVTDRPSTSHEYMFLLAKRTKYYYDHVAVQEQSTGGAPGNITHKHASAYERGDEKHRVKAGLCKVGERATRNLRTVWKIASQPYREAHFATFPPRLVEPCIKAGTSERGCCPHCGAPWQRLIERQRVATRPGNSSKVYRDSEGSPYERHNGTIVGNRDPQRHITRIVTTGWVKSCACPAHDPRPCVVLDPFGGSGATAVMAEHLGRRWVLCELNAEYAAMAGRRIKDGYRPPQSKQVTPRRRANGDLQRLLEFA
jgi:DNA modification methylase